MARFLSRILNCKKNKEIKITKVFHSCFVIEYSDGVRVLIDPYFGTAVPERFTLTEKPPYSKEKIPKINLILLTHEHFDHFEKDTINYLVKRDNCIVAGPRNVMNELTDLPKNNMRVVSIDDKLICSMINIRVLPCQHPQSFYPLAFLLEYENTKIYYAGDTENLPNVSFDADIAIMPAGGTFTADLFVFVSMARRLNPKFAIPMHYNTFNIIKLDLDRLQDRCNEKLKDTKLIILDNGKDFNYKIN